MIGLQCNLYAVSNRFQVILQIEITPISQICAFDTGVPLFNSFIRGEPLKSGPSYYLDGRLPSMNCLAKILINIFSVILIHIAEKSNRTTQIDNILHAHCAKVSTRSR